MQIEDNGKSGKVIGYGNTSFDSSAIDKGVITDIEAVAKATHEMFEKQFVGDLTTRRVAMSLPNEHSFSRVFVLPKMSENDLRLAVQSEAEQSIPVRIDELYYDYQVVSSFDDDTQEIQLVASPKSIVQSYLNLATALNLEVACVETNISAVTRIVTHSEGDDVVSLIIDLGSTAADLSIYDGNSVRITSTADCGSEDFTRLIAQKLGVTSNQAHTIKTRYGLEPSKKQKEILDAIQPELTKLITEIRKTMRYYGERASDGGEIGQVIILGGGANLPGLSTYLTDQVRLPTRLCDPWHNLSFAGLQPPHQIESTIYTTAGGLSLVSLRELAE